MSMNRKKPLSAFFYSYRLKEFRLKAVRLHFIKLKRNNKMLLVAIGCGRLKNIIDIVKNHSFVVFGTMDGSSFKESNLSKDFPVYFYETG